MSRLKNMTNILLILVVSAMIAIGFVGVVDFYKLTKGSEWSCVEWGYYGQSVWRNRCEYASTHIFNSTNLNTTCTWYIDEKDDSINSIFVNVEDKTIVDLDKQPCTRYLLAKFPLKT